MFPTVRPEQFLVKNPKFVETKTDSGVAREYTHVNGAKFREYTSHATVFGMPFYHSVRGISPETGKKCVARGFIAVGQRSRGVVAIGQMAEGYLAVGQLALGRVFALGQLAVAPLAIGQFAVAFFAIGSMIAAIAGIAQVGIAGTGIFQLGATLWGGIGMKIVPLL